MNDENRQRLLRLLDANANRAAEGLRTIEDVARLVREDRLATEWVKTLRHQLADACQGLGRSGRLKARSAETDAGTQVTTSSELTRGDWWSIVSAAAERVTQSLRCLEEFSKLLPTAVEVADTRPMDSAASTATARFKQLRYEAYDVLARVELRLADERTALSGRLYLLLDCTPSLDEFTACLLELAAAGVDYFQIRDKLADGSKLMRYARAAVSCLHDSHAQLIINDRVDIALASGASGVHLGQEDLPLTDARRASQGKLWIGVSTHNLTQAVLAQQAGADYIGCGPMFPSTTKSFDAFPGLTFLNQVASQIAIPAFAIGGIDLGNVASLVEAGCRRIAVSSAILQADQPAEAARALRQALR